jgi:hypothetical protein
VYGSLACPERRSVSCFGASAAAMKDFTAQKDNETLRAKLEELQVITFRAGADDQSRQHRLS